MATFLMIKRSSYYPLNICATRLLAQVLSGATTAKSPGKSLKLFDGGASLACLLCQRTLSGLPGTVLSVEGGVDCRGVGDGTRGVGLPLATAQGGENVLGSPVLAFGEPLAYLAYDRPRHPIRFEPANELFLAYRELDALQVALHVLSRAGGKVLPQKVHGFGLSSSTRSVSAHPMIQQTHLWSAPICQSVCSRKSNHVRR